MIYSFSCFSSIKLYYSAFIDMVVETFPCGSHVIILMSRLWAHLGIFTSNRQTNIAWLFKLLCELHNVIVFMTLVFSTELSIGRDPKTSWKKEKAMGHLLATYGVRVFDSTLGRYIRTSKGFQNCPLRSPVCLSLFIALFYL